MATSPKGFTQISATQSPDGPAQINGAELFVENLIGEHVDTISLLPASGNWPGRTITVIDTMLVYAWSGTAWKLVSASSDTANISNWGTGWSSVSTAGHTARVRRQGNLVTLHGGIQYATGANYNNMFTVPDAFLPVTSGTQFIGTAMVSLGSGNGQAVALVIAAGKVSSAGSGYSTGSLPAGAIVTLGGCDYWMD
jgi:hypothetical protein